MEYNHLIILGNGFDLECGLHTTYQDFFDERFGIEALYEIDNKIRKADCRKRLKEKLKYHIQADFYSNYFNDVEFINKIIISTFNENIQSLGNLAEEQKRIGR